MVTILKVDGTETTQEKITLKEAQAAVGGYVERVKLPKRRWMLVNEEGIPKRLKPNPKASELAGQTLLGDVVILDRMGEMTA